MSRKRKILSLVTSALFIISCICVVGCYKEKEEDGEEREYFKRLPSQFSEEDKLVICVNTMNQELLKERTMSAGFIVNILSKEPLDGDDVQVNIDIKTPYTVSYSASGQCQEKFSKFLCLQYNDFDWKYLKQLEASTLQEDKEKLIELNNSIDEEYKKLTAEEFPVFYNNVFNIQFDVYSEVISTVNEDESFREVEFVINGEKYVVDVGNVYFNYTFQRQSRSAYGEYDLNFTSIGIVAYNIEQNSEGLIRLPGFEMNAEKDVTIKNIKLDNEMGSISIDKADISIISDDMTINQSWEQGKSIFIPAGSKAYVNVQLKDLDFAGKESYSVNAYIVVEYESGSELYRCATQALCASRYNAEMMYAIYKDGISMSSFYNDYREN